MYLTGSSCFIQPNTIRQKGWGEDADCDVLVCCTVLESLSPDPRQVELSILFSHCKAITKYSPFHSAHYQDS